MNWSLLFCPVAILLASCQQARPVGFVGTLSGPSSELGISGRDGARLFVEQMGTAFLSCDDRANPVQAGLCVRQLADSGVTVVIGPMTSGLIDSAIAEAQRKGVLLVSPTVSADRLTGRDDALVRVIGTNLDQADTLAGILATDKIRQPVILWEERNAIYTRAVAERIAKTGSGMACTLSGYRSGPDLEFDSLVHRNRQADAFVIAGSAMDAALLAKAVRRSKSVARLYGSQFAMGNDLLRVAGPDAEGMVIAAAAGFADSTPARRSFANQFQARFARIPSFGAAFAWEAAVVSRNAWNAASGEEAKRRILSQPRQAPLDDTLDLDKFGDTRRRVVAHVVHGARFVVHP